MARSRIAAPLVIALATGLFAFYAFVPVIWPDSIFGLATRGFFGTLCHQVEARSFTVGGHLMPVCHRCTGIYVGVPLGALLAFGLALDPLRLRNWAMVLVPMAIQVSVAWIWDVTDLWYLRVLTGAMAGAGAGLLLARLLGSPSPTSVPPPLNTG